jgi:hypothetical protein
MDSAEHAEFPSDECEPLRVAFLRSLVWYVVKLRHIQFNGIGTMMRTVILQSLVLVFSMPGSKVISQKTGGTGYFVSTTPLRRVLRGTPLGRFPEENADCISQGRRFMLK